jgi:hypothetical protein
MPRTAPPFSYRRTETALGSRIPRAHTVRARLAQTLPGGDSSRLYILRATFLEPQYSLLIPVPTPVSESEVVPPRPINLLRHHLCPSPLNLAYAR